MHTSFWWKPLHTSHKWPHSSTLIVFFCENKLFQRGWGVFVILVEIPEGWGGHQFPAKWKIQEGWGGGVLSEIPSVVWIFSATTHYNSPFTSGQPSSSNLMHTFLLTLNKGTSLIPSAISGGLRIVLCTGLSILPSKYWKTKWLIPVMIFLTQVHLQLSDLSPWAIIELSKLFKSTMLYRNMTYSSKCKMILFEIQNRDIHTPPPPPN